VEVKEEAAAAVTAVVRTAAVTAPLLVHITPHAR
jgi:hypothetical protein